MYTLYILKSSIKDWYYIGHTINKLKRLEYHNKGKVRSTKPYAPFSIIYEEIFNTRSEAFKKEQQIKRYKHVEAFKKLIGA